MGALHDPDLLPHTSRTCLGLPGQEAGPRRKRRGLPAGPQLLLSSILRALIVRARSGPNKGCVGPR